jgi:inosine/xanthosine triphosphatase
MKTIVVSSKNPVKIAATRAGFERMFPEEQFEIISVPVPSGVSDQPKSDFETYTGAYNRTENVIHEFQHADFYIGIEGGIAETGNEMEAFAWVVVQAKDGIFGKARTSTFFLPQRIRELILEGKELGEADDIVFGRINSKLENGAVGFLTDDVVSRTTYYTEAVILALIPFKKPELYS